jgi:hypothetical protein
MGEKLKNKMVESKMGNKNRTNHVSTRESKIQEGKTPTKHQYMKMGQHKKRSNK